MENGISSSEAKESETNISASSSVRKEAGCSRKAAWMKVATPFYYLQGIVTR